MSRSMILLIVAIICFVVATLGLTFPNFHFGWAGLVFLTLAYFPSPPVRKG